MNRTYKITCHIAPNCTLGESQTISGSFSFSYYDAAKKYAADNLPGYDVILGGVPYPQGRRFDAINNEMRLGASIFVSETIY